MKQTNHQFYDFLDFEIDLDNDKKDSRLWKACKPTDIASYGLGVVLTIPFQCQKRSNDIEADLTVARKTYKVYLRAYGSKILRLCIGFDAVISESSEMIQMADAINEVALFYEIDGDTWIVIDRNGETRAKIDLSDCAIDYWSDLLPAPQETFEATLYPDGKKEVVISGHDQFFPARVDAMPLAFIEKNGKPHSATLSFESTADEKFVGTGERFSKLDLSGRTFQLKNQDGQGVNNKRTYKNVPFYLSSELYGLFLHTSAYCKFSMADFSTRSVQIYTEEPVLDLFLIGDASPERIIYRYKQLTGFPEVPPIWSFGIWMSRMTYFSEEEVIEICDRLREEKFPCDVIHLDTGWFETDWLCEWKFNSERFPDPKAFISKLNKRGFRLSLWQMPYISENAQQFKEATENKYIGVALNTPKEKGSNFSNLDYAGTIDFTYPKAVKWYQDLLQELFDMGVSAIKTDFGEEIHMNAEYHGMPPELLNNLYGLLYQKAAYEITKSARGEGIIWARAGWSGCQRYPIHWGGDAAASWEGMAGSLKGGLHLGLSGFGFWSHDVPGFHGVPNFMNSVIPDDLYVRWTQFGVFTSHIRYHGTSKREPYFYPNISGIVRKWWQLRYALIPYLLEQSKACMTSGYPVLRALLMHHPDDVMCWHIDDQYYLGSDFLVAPIMNSENSRNIYLPEGEWVNFFTGTEYHGTQWIKNFETNLQDMPVWIRKGSSIPLYTNEVSCTDEMNLDTTISLEVDSDFKGIWQYLKIEDSN
ncbi:glycoside hydrolase family 31 protein [Leeuwenhoekiella marinoflava]|uniref:Alpha-D-xyloside xylohydrolase n=2 Tax=Leeuwenhoekiella marinoflava TaxID=988 RepID=A0A4Q0PNW9_9FLAO|nr:alpha-xylosidase [Leeuwenhoekiella marinoflava]RXG32217.1 alpha-D-xyloside xylohydrolase [Leeuwenhoekiella marinoflava]SHE83061.1 alpha-D-xyloside xylohydrolase [Leeuwenhoekiella marinoflava DSM 3653]